MRHIIPVSGKDSACLAVLLRQAHPQRRYELFFNATGTELPETICWLGRVSRHLDMEITHVGRDLASIIEEQGILPSIKKRYCTRMAKIHPMEDFIGPDDAVVYFGLRADEDRAGYQNAKMPNIRPAYPLREWGITFEHVYRILQEIDLLPPAFRWLEMETAAREQAGDFVDTLPIWTRRSLFAWRTRTNCFHCFFQRYYEWVGLSEHHPHLFAHALQMEDDTGAEGFFWNSNGKSLRQIQREAPTIKARHLRQILKKIHALQQGELFPVADGLPVSTACGLFCSK